MSLTSMLKGNTQACIELQTIISCINIDENMIVETNPRNEICVPYGLKDYKKAGLVGTAFDYVSRFLLKKYQYAINNIITSEEKIYIAQNGLNILIRKNDPKSEKAIEFYENGIGWIDRFIKTGDVDIKKIINVAIFFAKLENIFRSGYERNLETIKILFTKESDNVVDEIYNLQASFEKNFINNHFKMKDQLHDIIYNPSFGRCSLAVGGADADIIMDNIIIDFKTTKNLTSIKKDFKQILGYYLFSKIIMMETVNSVSLYLVRYNKFITYKFNGTELNYGAYDRFCDFMQSRV